MWEIQLTTTERRRNYLVSEQNDHTTKFLTESLLSVEMKKCRNLWLNQLSLSILELSKKIMNEFWIDHVKPIYGEKEKLC